MNIPNQASQTIPQKLSEVDIEINEAADCSKELNEACARLVGRLSSVLHPPPEAEAPNKQLGGVTVLVPKAQKLREINSANRTSLQTIFWLIEAVEI